VTDQTPPADATAIGQPDAATRMYSAEEVSAIVVRRLAAERRRFDGQLAAIAEESARAAIARVSRDADATVRQGRDDLAELLKSAGMSIDELERAARVRRAMSGAYRRHAERRGRDVDDDSSGPALAAPVAPAEPRIPYRSPGAPSGAPLAQPSERDRMMGKLAADGQSHGLRATPFAKS
jgi:hypothetical protein